MIEAADAEMAVILQAAHRQREDVRRLAFNPLVNIILNLMLLPALGPIGAAIGRAGGVFASATLRYLLIARVLTRMNLLRFAMKPAFISIGVGWVCFALHDVGHPAWLLFFYVAASAVLLRISSCFSPSVIKDMMSLPSSQD